MASQPFKTSILTKLAQLANPDDLDTPNLSTDDQAFAYLLSYMENGGRLSRLANDLGCSRFLLDRWVKGTPERAEQFSRARARGADALVDEGGDLIDKADRDTIAVANARAGWRKWLASKYDPLTYGDKQQPSVAIGALHLHASLPLPQLQHPPLNGSLGPTGDVGYPTATKALPSDNIVVEPPVNDTVGLG